MPSIINSDDGVVSGTSGLKSTGGNDGLLNIQSNGSTVVAMTGSGVSVTGTLTASGATTLSGAVSASSLSVNSNNISADNSLGFRNRIINGAMMIDQRNAGAAVTTDDTYVVDRFFMRNSTDGAVSVQRSTTAPSGFVNSLAWTTTTADASLGATQYCGLFQRIEGLNLSDLAWGTADAKTITISFRVRSSLTGTFGGSVRNSAGNRSYPFTYTISAANTWESKSITIAGDTTGTWLTTNGIGMDVSFALGVGSTLSGTAGAWSANNYISATGATAVISTLNATFYITGVQLEVGTVATPFERRPYGTELMLCQRYFYSFDTNELYAQPGSALTTNNSSTRFWFPVTMRAAPTATRTGTVGDSSSAWTLYNNGAYRTVTSITLNNLNTGSFRTEWATSSGVAGSDAVLMYCFNGNGGATLTVSAEL